MQYAALYSIILYYLAFHCIILYIVLFFSIVLIMLSFFELLYYVYIVVSLYFQTCLCRYFYDPCIFTQLRFNCAAAPVLDDDGYDFSVKNAAIDRES